MHQRDGARRVIVGTMILVLVAACNGATPSASSAPATALSTPSATAAMDPSPQQPLPTAAFLPVHGTAYGGIPLTVPTSDGGLYVARYRGDDPRYCGDDQSCDLDLWAFDGSGRPRPGWPVTVASGGLYSIAVASDDTLRVVGEIAAYAYDLGGRPLPGWPVRPGGPHLWIEVVGRELRLQLVDGGWTSVSADGSVTRRTGTMPGAHGYAVSIERVADGVVRELGEPVRVTLSDERGVLSGWPIDVPYGTSDPIVGPDGTVYLVVQDFTGDPPGTARLMLIDRSGKVLSDRTTVVPESVPHVGTWAEPYIPRSPVLGSDGSVWLVAESSAYSYDPNGRLRTGWPVRMSVPLGTSNYCGECMIDCTSYETVPFVDRIGTLYLLRAPSTEGSGGSVLAIGLDGKVVSGWPVQLKRSGSEPWTGSVGPDGTVFVNVYEPESIAGWSDECLPAASETTLALRPDGTARYRVTLVDP